MAVHIGRREFITLLGGGTGAWPIVAWAQQPAMPVIGYLYGGTSRGSTYLVDAFRKGLSEMGYLEGKNVTIEYRFTEGDSDRIPELAADLVRRRVALIATPLSTPAALAAKAATTKIPIIFGTASDPVQIGLVASLNRPGGNATGISNINVELMPKRLELLHELLPRAVRFGVLVNPDSPMAESIIREVRVAAAAIDRQIEVFTARNNREIDTAFANLVQKGIDALLVGPDALTDNRRVQVTTLAVYHRMPTIYAIRQFAEAGGLMSYGTSDTDLVRQIGIYAGRVLKGERPDELPVMRPTKFEFVINMQTARTFGFTVPPTLLAVADEVIE
jgi:putative tryptophan/tyrosine transport system substrate-binding protein